MLPSELPDVPNLVEFDCETSGLYPDSGHRVSTVSVAWYEGDEIHSHAWPFHQGLYGKPEYHTARYGWLTKPDVYKSGPRKGQPVERRIRQLTAEEVLEPDPNLDRRQWDALVGWLMDRAGLVAHNLLFDVLMVSAGVGRPDDPWPGPPVLDLLDKGAWCTLVGQHILDPQHPLSLKDVAERRWGFGKGEQDLLFEHLKARYVPTKRYDLADWAVMEPYARGDTALGIRLAREQWQRLKAGEGRFDRMDIEMEVLRTCVRMEHRGLPFNSRDALAWAKKMEIRIEELGASLPFEPTDAGARAFFFGSGHVERTMPDESGGTRTPALGLTPIRVTEKKKVASVDAEVMQLLVQQEIPQAAKLQEYNLVSDAVSRYYRGYSDATGIDGRLRTRFRQFGTGPGRMSCERVNLQAIPHDHRLLAAGSAIMAEAPSPRALVEDPDGWELWHMDLQQAELRVASQFARCQAMIDIFTEGRDPHGETAIQLGLATGPDDPGWKKARSVIGKRANFSLIFGIGHVKFRADLRKQSGLDLESPGHVCVNPGTKGRNTCNPKNCKVKKLVTNWRELYPEFGRAIDIHAKAAERDGWTMIRDGIKKWYTQYEIAIRDWHKAFNNKVQGNIGQLTKRWSIQVDRFLMDEDIDPDFGGLLLNIHDALLVLLPKGRRDLAEQCAQLGRDLWDDWFTVVGGVDLALWHN